MDTDNCIIIANNGQAIAKTNYFDSDLAARGMYFLSWNAGAGRLLVPDARKLDLAEMRSSKYVIVSRGPWVAEGGQPAIELLFEDRSEEPFVLTLGMELYDRLLPKNEMTGQTYISVWTRGGQKLRLVAKLREVDELPCLAEWSA